MLWRNHVAIRVPNCCWEFDIKNLISYLTWKNFYTVNLSVQSKIYLRVRTRAPAIVSGGGSKRGKTPRSSRVPNSLASTDQRTVPSHVDEESILDQPYSGALKQWLFNKLRHHWAHDANHSINWDYNSTQDNWSN